MEDTRKAYWNLITIYSSGNFKFIALMANTCYSRNDCINFIRVWTVGTYYGNAEHSDTGQEITAIGVVLF